MVIVKDNHAHNLHALDMLELTFKSMDSNFFQFTSIWLALDAVRDEFEEFAFSDDSPSDTEGVALKDPCVLQPNSETKEKNRSKFHVNSSLTLEQKAGLIAKYIWFSKTPIKCFVEKTDHELDKIARLFDYCIVSIHLWVTSVINVYPVIKHLHALVLCN